ncbi:MAG: dienelactone hydrolase family protein [Actinomycetota bacterium]|nr:dienelactone hydrolase family protein [Actinomycetota bacterium]
MSDQPEADDPLDDFEQRRLAFDGDEKRVYVAGTGPAVVVMTELPGITPHVARFARWVRDAGFTAWMPSLFGVDGAAPSLEYARETLRAPCVRREFKAFADGEPSPMASWLRRLAAHAHTECGGPGVGAIGMCFTGNFALTMTLEPAVLAPVMSQPALPFDDPASTFMTSQELSAVKQRMDADDLTVLAYRFEGDTYCQAARFETFACALGDRFVGRVLPDAAAGPVGWTGVPHSVVTTSLIDEAGQPTVAARDEILGFFARRLQPA